MRSGKKSKKRRKSSCQGGTGLSDVLNLNNTLSRAELITANDTGRDVLRDHRLHITSFLETYAKSFTIDEINSNSYSEIGKPLYERFLNECVDTNMNVKLVFHGTPTENISNILEHGLDPNRRQRQALGQGEYFGFNAETSHPYCKNGCYMIVFAVLTDPIGITRTTSNVIVVTGLNGLG